MYTVYFIFFQVASATATRFGLSRGLLGLQYDQINESESESESESNTCCVKKLSCIRRNNVWSSTPVYCCVYHLIFPWLTPPIIIQSPVLTSVVSLCTGCSVWVCWDNDIQLQW